VTARDADLTGQVLIHTQRYGQGERIIMPLAADGVQGDGVFGATEYSMTPNAPYGTAARRFLAADQIAFFALD